MIISGSPEELDPSIPVVLDVGGFKYKTTVGTLTGVKDSILSYLVFTPLADGLMIRESATRKQDPEPIFIDRDGESFRHILNYLRNRSLPLRYMTMSEKNTLLEEAKYYNMKVLVSEITRSIRREEETHSQRMTLEKQFFLVGTATEYLSSAVAHYSTLGWDIDSITPSNRVVLVNPSHNLSNANDMASSLGTSAGVDEIYRLSKTSLTPVQPALNRPYHIGLNLDTRGSGNVTTPTSSREYSEHDKQVTSWYVLLLSRKLTCSDISLLDKLSDV